MRLPAWDETSRVGSPVVVIEPGWSPTTTLPSRAYVTGALASFVLVGALSSLGRISERVPEQAATSVNNVAVPSARIEILFAVCAVFMTVLSQGLAPCLAPPALPSFPLRARAPRA
jgi:hypothetical protein